MTAMRMTQRRAMLTRARSDAERTATTAISALLSKRYKAVGRDLRRANLRKRLQKASGDPIALFKADDGIDDWDAWGDMFAQQLRDMFADAVTGIYSAESKFWLSRNYAPGHVDPAKVVDEYQARTGRQIKQIADTTRDNVLQAITDWYKTDASLPELIDSLGQWFGEDRATRIARTEVSYVASQVSRDIYNNVGVQYFNVDLATDPGPCPQNICPDQFDANPHPVGDDMPPYHVNCVLPGNEVLIPDLIAASQSFYVGLCVEIVTLGGRKLTVTPNHPILTPRGWVKAKFLRETDYVMVATDGHRIVESINPYNQNRPTSIEQIFDSAKVRSSMASVSVPATAKDFNGDGRFVDSNIEIVNVDSLLRRNVKSESSKPYGEFAFDDARMSGASFLGLRALDLSFDRVSHTPNGGMGSSSLGAPLFCRHTRKPDRVRLSNSPARNPVLTQDTLDNFPVNSPLTSEFLFRFASDVTGDQIVSVRNFDFSGHVYDLQDSQYSLYICNSIITHNCQCGTVPANEDGSVFI